MSERWDWYLGDAARQTGLAGERASRRPARVASCRRGLQRERPPSPGWCRASGMAMTYGSPPQRTRGRVRERSMEQRQAHGGVRSRGMSASQ